MPLNLTKSKKLALSTPSGGAVETAVGSALVHHPDGSVESLSTDKLGLPVVVGPGPFANVGVQAKVTINLGNYENVQVQVSIHLPSANSHGELLDSFKYASAWVDERMEELTAKYSPKKE